MRVQRQSHARAVSTAGTTTPKDSSAGKVDRIITFSSGATMDWPGQSVSDAYEKCGGALREPRTFGRLVYWLGL
jgi:hypothetical protein